MSASVEIIGVNQEKLLENLPVQYAALIEKYKGSAQNISANPHREYEEDIKLWDWFQPGYENLLSRLQQEDYDYYFYAYSF